MAGKTTIPAGSQIQFPVLAGSVVLLTGLGSAIYAPGIQAAASPINLLLGQIPTRIGPFPRDGTVVVTADATGTGVTFALFAATDLTAANSVGASLPIAKIPVGMTDPVPAIAPIVVRGSLSLGGDSLVAFGDVAGALTQTASGILAATGGKTACSVWAWVEAHMRSGRLDLVTNRGVGSTTIDVNTASLIGATSPQYGTGATAGLLADTSQAIATHSGTNHLNPTIDPAAPTVAQIVQKLRRQIGITASRKGVHMVEGIYAIGQGSVVNHAARKNDIPLINAQVAAICAQYQNVIYLDPSVLSIDGGATGDPRFYLASDLLHLNGYGAYILGKSYAAQLEGRVVFLPAFRSSKTVLMPEMAGTSGGKVPNSGVINGTMPGNMRMIIGSGTTAGWPVVNLTTANNRLTAQIDNSGGLTVANITVDLNSRTAYNGNLANGDIVIASATLGVTNPVGLRRHDFLLTQNSEGTGTLMAISAMAQSNQETINGNAPILPPHSYGPITLRTQPVTLNDTLASLNVGFSFQLAAGGSVTVDVGDLTLDAVVAV